MSAAHCRDTRGYGPIVRSLRQQRVQEILDLVRQGHATAAHADELDRILCAEIERAELRGHAPVPSDHGQLWEGCPACGYYHRVGDLCVEMRCGGES